MKLSLLTILVSFITMIACSKKNFTSGLRTDYEGIIDYTSSKDFHNKPVRIHYYIPVGDESKMQVQVVLHGASRNAGEYLNGWKEKANSYGLIVLALEYSEENFTIEEYSQGMIMDSLDTKNPSNKTLFFLLDQIFIYSKEKLDINQSNYNLFGHSAGGQFVHRFLQFHDSPYLNMAVAANSGWYTYPDENIKFPYGVDGLGLNAQQIKKNYYSKDLLILLGTADTLRTKNLRVTKNADAQGMNRLERGINYYSNNKNTASQLDFPFKWKIDYVQNSGHDHLLMTQKAADLLYSK